MSYDTGKDAEVTIGDGVVVVRRPGTSRTIIANTLEIERDDAGRICRIYVDRLVHRPKEGALGDWNVSGAFSTIFEPTSNLAMEDPS